MSNTYDGSAYTSAISERSKFERRVIGSRAGDVYWQSDGTLFIPDYRQDLKDEYARLQKAVNDARAIFRRTG